MSTADAVNVAIAGLSAVVTGGAWYAAARANRIAKEANGAAQAANRTADTVAMIEADRRHLELTPEFAVTGFELGNGTQKAMMRIELTGPIDVPPLSAVRVRIQDDGYTHVPDEAITQA